MLNKSKIIGYTLLIFGFLGMAINFDFATQGNLNDKIFKADYLSDYYSSDGGLGTSDFWSNYSFSDSNNDSFWDSYTLGDSANLDIPQGGSSDTGGFWDTVGSGVSSVAGGAWGMVQDVGNVLVGGAQNQNNGYYPSGYGNNYGNNNSGIGLSYNNGRLDYSIQGPGYGYDSRTGGYIGGNGYNLSFYGTPLLNLGGNQTPTSFSGNVNDTVFGTNLSTGTMRGILTDQVKGNLHGIAQSESLIDVVLGWVQFALPYAGLLAFVGIIYAGFLYLTGFAEEGNVKKAKSIVGWSIGGLILIYLAYSIVSTFINPSGGGSTSTGTVPQPTSMIERPYV